MENARPPFNRLSGKPASPTSPTTMPPEPAPGAAQDRRCFAGRGVEAVVADKKSVRGVDRVNGEPILVVLQPVYRRGNSWVSSTWAPCCGVWLLELSQTLNAQGRCSSPLPGPSDAVAFHDMVLVGVSDELRGLLAPLRTLPSMDQPSIQTLTTEGSAHAVTFHPLRSPDGTVQGVDRAGE